MDVDTILDSKSLKAAALVIGIISGLIKITGVFSQTIASTIASICFALAIFYFMALLLQWLGKKFLGNASDNAKGCYYYSAKRYGIGYSSMDITFDIKKDGSATVIRIIEIEAFSEVKTLDTYLLIPEESVEGNKRDIEPVQVESLTPGWNLELDAMKKNNKVQLLSALMIISPPLQSGNKIKYKVIEKLPPKLYAINFTRESLNSRENPFDYAGWNISRPSKKLCLKVAFPENFQPTVYNAEVRYATASGFPSVRIQHEEQKQLKPKLSKSPGVKNFHIFSLDVEHPMTGLIYILRWKPVPKI